MILILSSANKKTTNRKILSILSENDTFHPNQGNSNNFHKRKSISIEQIKNLYSLYRNIKSLCCVTGTNSVVGQLYFKNKQTNELVEKDRFMVTRGRDEGRENLLKVVKRQKLPVIR